MNLAPAFYSSISELQKLYDLSYRLFILSSFLCLLFTTGMYLAGKQIDKLKSSRELNSKQVQILQNYFNNNDKAKIKLSSIHTDQETFNFATRVGDVFIQSGWEVDKQIDKIQPVGGQYTGITIESNKNLLSSARVIKNAFNSININTSIENEDNNSDYIHLIIGSK